MFAIRVTGKGRKAYTIAHEKNNSAWLASLPRWTGDKWVVAQRPAKKEGERDGKGDRCEGKRRDDGGA